MKFVPLNAFLTDMKGKTVRFRSSFQTANLSNRFQINLTHPASLNVPVGSLGIIYQVSGATLFIGFGRNLKTVPSDFGPSSYAATIQLYIHHIDKIEIQQ